MKIELKPEIPTTEASHGQVFFDGVLLANYWTVPNDPAYGRGAGKVDFNPDELAFRLEFPDSPWFDSEAAMVKWIEEVLAKKECEARDANKNLK
jgi:hypothetical protein